MAEYKFQAGKSFETVTKRELADALGEHLRSWVAETAVGGRFTRFAATGVIAGGVLSIGGAGGGIEGLGPPPGFLWSVRRMHITGLNSADVAAIYINDESAASIVANTTDLPVAANRSFLWSNQLFLNAGENLLVVGRALTATGTVTVAGQVLELPVGLAWKLVT